ncbi:MAG: hypothetical protein J3K34DRAFT_224003 [Monoraphidium minutum]|nr:MAG: hypothetical protein J3K34DRAFT_224003 [Monoraphidium minutum]
MANLRFVLPLMLLALLAVSGAQGMRMLRGANIIGKGAGLRGAYYQPSYVQPAYVQPAYVQPAYVQPAYVQPTYVQAAYVQPAIAYAQPAYYGGYAQPVYGGYNTGGFGLGKGGLLGKH